MHLNQWFGRSVALALVAGVAVACADRASDGTSRARSSAQRGTAAGSDDSDAEPLACTAAAGEEAFYGPTASAGRLEASDPVQDGRLATFDGVPVPPRSCTEPPATPAVTDSDKQFHYDAYTYRNRSSEAACVSATVLSENRHPFPFQVQVYLDSFDPTDIQANYLSDEGRADGYVYNQTFSVPPMRDFVLVISGVVSDAPDPYGSSYHFGVGGCGANGGGGSVDAGSAPDAGTDSGGSGGDTDAGGGGKSW